MCNGKLWTKGKVREAQGQKEEQMSGTVLVFGRATEGHLEEC